MEWKKVVAIIPVERIYRIRSKAEAKYEKA